MLRHFLQQELTALRARLFGRIKSALTEKGLTGAELDSKMAEAEKAFASGGFFQWLLDNLPTIIAEIGPLLQAIATIIAMFG